MGPSTRGEGVQRQIHPEDGRSEGMQGRWPWKAELEMIVMLPQTKKPEAGRGKQWSVKGALREHMVLPTHWVWTSCFQNFEKTVNLFCPWTPSLWCHSSHKKLKQPFIQKRLLRCKYLKKPLLGGYSEFCSKDFFFLNKLFSECSLGLSLVSKTVQHAWPYQLRTIPLEPSKQVTALPPSGLVRRTMVWWTWPWATSPVKWPVLLALIGCWCF